MTELVVHGGFRTGGGGGGGEGRRMPAPAPRPAVHRTVYLEAPGATGPGEADERHTLGLFATFMTAFVITTALVLGIYASRTDAAPQRALPPPAPMVVPEAPVVASPAPVQPAGAPGESSEAPSEASSGEDPGVSEVAEPVVAEPEPVPAVAPRIAPPVPRVARPRPTGPKHQGVAAFNGRYSGTIDGSPVAFVFRFGNDGVVRAEVKRRGEPVTEATGTYRLEGSMARITLDDEGAATMSSYTGTITPRSVSGQITLSTGEIQYFTAKR